MAAWALSIARIDRERRRPVAFKVMNLASAATILRFKREFRTLLGVAHPNLVTLYELIFDGKTWFLTMELLEGVNFLQYVRGEARSVDHEIEASATIGQGPPAVASGHDQSSTTGATETARWIRLREATRQLATGIAWLHAAGKLHRDIKPTNVIVTREGRVVLLDFGLVAEQGLDGHHHSTEHNILGTAAYMAPEQAAGLPVSSAADWYSVGVMLFEALTGRLPFSGEILSVLMKKQTIRPASAIRPGFCLPEDLKRVVRRPAAATAGGSTVRTRRDAPAGKRGL